jgi:hypothetical protein
MKSPIVEDIKFYILFTSFIRTGNTAFIML